MKRRKRCAKPMSSDPRKRGDQRRLIDITEREMLRAGKIIKRISKGTVSSRGREMKSKIAKANEINPRPKRYTPRRVFIWFLVRRQSSSPLGFKILTQTSCKAILCGQTINLALSVDLHIFIRRMAEDEI